MHVLQRKTWRIGFSILDLYFGKFFNVVITYLKAFCTSVLKLPKQPQKSIHRSNSEITSHHNFFEQATFDELMLRTLLKLYNRPWNQEIFLYHRHQRRHWAFGNGFMEQLWKSSLRKQSYSPNISFFQAGNHGHRHS